MSRKKRVDKNQKGIVEQLRNLGYSVELCYQVGNGFPDFIIGFNNWFTIPVELKSKGGKLTDDEETFHNRYKGYIITAYTLEEILLGIHRFYEYLYNEFDRSKRGKT